MLRILLPALLLLLPVAAPPAAAEPVPVDPGECVWVDADGTMVESRCDDFDKTVDHLDETLGKPGVDTPEPLFPVLRELCAPEPQEPKPWEPDPVSECCRRMDVGCVQAAGTKLRHRIGSGLLVSFCLDVDVAVPPSARADLERSCTESPPRNQTA